MSRIFLHPVDPRFGVSIRLLVGQFCTVGSSPAADHCLRAAGIEAMHCRIGCRLNGGFLECVNDDSTVLINGVPKTRARLSNGDRIKIGMVELKVDMPERSEKRSFSISFDDDENSSDGFSTIAGDFLSTPLDETADNESESVSSADGAHEEGTDNRDGQEAIEVREDDKADDEEDTVEIFGSEPDFDLTDPASDSVPESDFKRPPRRDGRPKPKKSNQRAVFEFDSVDAEDTPFTDEDLAAVESRGETINVENLSFFSAELAFAEVESDAKAPDSVAEDNFVTEELGESESLIPGGSPQMGKYWKWIGDTVATALTELEHREDELVCYFVNEHVELTECSFAEVRETAKQRKENRIFLVTNKDQIEVMHFLFAKRWNERMRHPEALNMSISILPARHIKALFEQIDAVVLVQKGEASLMRINGGR